jgi:hypothetical protein
MAKKSKGQTTTHVPVCDVRGKKTSQGRRNVGTATMNKNFRRSYKPNVGQG